MRILTMLKHMGPGGIQRAAQNYVRGYRERGHEVAVLCLVKSGNRGEALTREGIPIFVGGAVSELQEKARARALDWQPDLIHVHRAGHFDPIMTPNLRALRQALETNVPFLETNSFGKVDYSSKEDLVDLHLLKARWALWKWQQWATYYDEEPVGTVMPNVVDTDQFYPADGGRTSAFRERYDIPENVALFGRVGQPIRCKWSSIIFKAFSNVADRYPDCHLLVVGLPEDLQPEIDRLPTEIRRRITQISFLHTDEELRDCYSAIDVFLHASDIGESFGTVLAESMACRTPVITLSTPAHDNSQLEVVGHERGGLVVTDRTHMERAMVELLHNREQREEFGHRGAQWVQTHYGLSTVLDRLEAVIELLTDRPTPSHLRKRLEQMDEFTVEITKTEIDKRLDSIMGTTPLYKRLLMRLVHVPTLHRIQWNLRSS